MHRTKSFPSGIIHLAFCLLMAGCAVGPDYKAPTAAELSMPQTWQGANATPSAPDLAQWWQTFNDPALTSLINEALASNLDLKIAQSRVRQAISQRRIAYAGQLPSASASGSASSGGTNNASSDSYKGSLSAAWELDLFGANARASQAAQADAQATEANAYATRVELVAQVAQTYYELRNAQNRLEIARQNLASQNETLQFIEWRANAGLADALTLAQARAQQAQTAAGIPALETTLANSRLALAVLLGKSPEGLTADLATPHSLPTLPDQIAIGIPADTLRQRPDVQAVERTLAAETLRIGVAEANLYPSLTLNGSIGLEALSLADVLSGATIARTLAGTLAQTVFDGGRLREQLNIQTETQAQALATYQKTILTALQDVESALATYANARARTAQLAIAASNAVEADTLAGQQYSAGLIDYQNRLETQRTRLSAQDSYASAQIDEITALIALYRAMGGGWTPNTAVEKAQ